MKRDKTAVFQPHSDKVSDTAAVPQNTNEGSVFCFKSQGERDQRLHPFKNPKGGCERKKKIDHRAWTYCITDAEGECMASVTPELGCWQEDDSQCLDSPLTHRRGGEIRVGRRSRKLLLMLFTRGH